MLLMTPMLGKIDAELINFVNIHKICNLTDTELLVPVIESKIDRDLRKLSFLREELGGFKTWTSLLFL